MQYHFVLTLKNINDLFEIILFHFQIINFKAFFFSQMQAQYLKEHFPCSALLYCIIAIYIVLNCNSQCLLKANDCNITKWSLFTSIAFRAYFAFSAEWKGITSTDFS